MLRRAQLIYRLELEQTMHVQKMNISSVLRCLREQSFATKQTELGTSQTLYYILYTKQHIYSSTRIGISLYPFRMHGSTCFYLSQSSNMCHRLEAPNTPSWHRKPTVHTESILAFWYATEVRHYQRELALVLLFIPSPTDLNMRHSFVIEDLTCTLPLCTSPPFSFSVLNSVFAEVPTLSTTDSDELNQDRDSCFLCPLSVHLPLFASTTLTEIQGACDIFE